MASHVFERVSCVMFGAAMRLAAPVVRVLPLPQPMLMVGPGASERMAALVSGWGHTQWLVVVDPAVAGLPVMASVLAALTQSGARVVVYDRIGADAPIDQIEAGVAFFNAHACDAVLAVGGGSVMDAAKAIALSVKNPKQPMRSMAGYFKAKRGPVPLYVMPTTAGTGSEVTVAAVVSDPQAQCKRVVVDTRIVPRVAAIDPLWMTGLPPAVTAATGIDALTHAVEAFIGRWSSASTDNMALAAVGLIFKHLPQAVTQGDDLQAREQMAMASTYAGIAFTRANVGYVHAIAHQLGGRYHTPHGLANALVLPHVLRFLLPSTASRLALLAVRAGLGPANAPSDVLAQRFIDGVERLLRQVGIPQTLPTLRRQDIPSLARDALREAHWGYPVPRYMTQSQCEAILAALCESDLAQ